MICITLGHNEKPIWWHRFMDYVFEDSTDQLIERKEWAQKVNAALMDFGGRIQRNWTQNFFFITFRSEINYTMFVLRFS